MEKLAIEGGTPVNNKPFPGWPAFSEKSFNMVLEPLKTRKLNYWGGTYGNQFEKKLAEWHNSKYCVTTVNEYGAFHLALLATGLGEGDEIICPSYMYFPPLFAILNIGAIPILVDVDFSHTIDPKEVEKKVTKKTKAIIVSHMYGVVSDMGPILDIAQKNNLFVMEDCTECFGGQYKGKKTGTIGDVGCFNLCHTKHLITGGEGGAVITDNKDIYLKCFSLRDYGFNTDEGLDMIKFEQEFLYTHDKIGFNYRMTEIQSVLGLCELERMDDWNLPLRKKYGRFLTETLKTHPLVLHTPLDTQDRQNSFWWAPIVLDVDKLKVDIKQFKKAMEAEGVPVYGALWPELYKEKAYIDYMKARNLYDPTLECKTAKWLFDRTISLFTHPIYEVEHLKKYIEVFNKVAKAYMK
jgi:dTDP-4-amino-4,6-dideoxygalactose transaminase